MTADPPPFTYRQRKSGEVEVLHAGRIATVLRHRDAVAFLARMQTSDAPTAQRIMAQVTGNYRRGNERLAASHPRRRG